MKPAQKRVQPKRRRFLSLLAVLCLLLSGPLSISVETAAPAHADVGAPGWWGGKVCDTNNYPGSYPLGASYNGVYACGPGSYNQGGTDHFVRFFTTPSPAWGEYEWECVELVMRYMYLVYGIAPYDAPGGKDVVGNYSGTALTPVNNDGTSANPKLPSPGDIISVGAAPINPTTGKSPNPYGHTAVVTNVSVDASGNGTLTDMQQNATSNGVGTLTIGGGKITGTVLGGSVTGWLHNPSASPPPPPPVPTNITALIDDGGAVWAQQGLITGGGWTQETGPNAAKTIASGGGIQAWLDGCGAIWAQSTKAYGVEVQEAPCGSAAKLAVSSAGVQVELDGCNAIWARSGVGNSWTQEAGCGAATKIAVGGNTQAWVDGCGAVWAQSSIGYGIEVQETGCGAAASIAVGASGTQVWMDGCNAVWAQSSIGWGREVSESGCYAGFSVTIGNNVQVILNYCNQLYAENGIIAGGGWNQETSCGSAAAVSVGAEDNQFLLDGGGTIYARNGIGNIWVAQSGANSATAIAVG